ncbi:unnamed protein product [Phytophthora fragariaefolia]|uniref:Unnamed protein product n=1 Tax=Phytophthora fragariaefolia TaxID=1490495 RepID=A0A9W6XIZ4_9STRA|nr:unnamed protein product [Phytophthora fragariaefolia]
MAQTESLDPLAGQPTDEFGIPVSVKHFPQTDLPVWQYIHQLATPQPNSRSYHPHTHICVLCAAKPPMRAGKRALTWRNALMRCRMSTNAVSHIQRVHPEEFVAIADYKKRKRDALVSVAKAKGEGKSKSERAHTKRKTSKTQGGQAQQAKESEPVEAKNEVPVVQTKTAGLGALARRRATAKTMDLLKTWLISSGLPISTLQDETFQQLLKLSNSAVAAMPTASNLHMQVEEDFTKFSRFLRSYLAAESEAAMGLPFLSLRHDLRPLSGATIEDEAEEDMLSDQQDAFMSVTLRFIDSQWRTVDLVLAAKEVSRGLDQPANELVTRILSESYDIPSILNYARFQVIADEETPTLTNECVHESSSDEHEDQLTRTLRRCVVEALGVDTDTSVGSQTGLRRILRLLQDLVEYFEVPDRAAALAGISARHNEQSPVCTTSSFGDLYLSNFTSIGTIAELLRMSCARYRSYRLYFQSPVRPTATEPELETAWMQLSSDDWRAATEVEAILTQFAQFRLEERIAPRTGAVSPSYALLFRRLLSVTSHASSLKCLSIEDDLTTTSSPVKRAVRRISRRVDTFTPTGQQCVMRLRQLIAQYFPAPQTPSTTDDEIKAMLLDPRINPKAADLVTDTRAFRRAEQALRQEHRVVFELISVRHKNANPNSEGEVEDDLEDDEDDEEISALLMVDGPKNQPPAAQSTTSSGRRLNDTIAEDEARAWREWQQVYVAWDTLVSEGADLFDKGQYNLLKLYHHVNILKWFRDVGQRAHPAASLLARMYLGQQLGPSQTFGASLRSFMKQEDPKWVSSAVRRAEKRCILHHNWRQYQHLSANALSHANDGSISIDTV